MKYNTRLTIYEIALIVAVILFGYISIQSIYTKSHRQIVIETVAYNLSSVEDAIDYFESRPEEFKNFSRDKTNLSMVYDLMKNMGKKPIDWPKEADLGSLDFKNTNLTMKVLFKNEEVFVSKKDFKGLK